MKTIKWGILGAGKIAGHFANDIAKIPHAEIYAIASKSQQRADVFAAKYTIKKAFGTYQDLVTCSEIDVIYIATRHPDHHKNTLLCLTNGKPVLCEKPFAMNKEQVAEMIATARKQDVFLMEAIWTRFLPIIQLTLDKLKNGIIGDVFSLRADFGFAANYDPNSRLFDPKLGGGALLDIGIYPIFLAQLIFGKPLKINALAHFATTGVDDEISIALKFPKEQFAHLHATTRATTPCVAEIYGTKGILKIHSRWHEANSIEINLKDGTSEKIALDYDCKGYKFEAEHVMECLQNGWTESPLLPLEFSHNLMELLDTIREEIGLKYE